MKRFVTAVSSLVVAAACSGGSGGVVLDDYREAYRTQLGGEAYTEFLELCKESLNI